MKAPYFLLLALPLALASCSSQIPPGEYLIPADQRTVRSAAQWDAIATDIAQRLQAALITPETTETVVLYVERPDSGVFNDAFHQLLITQLIEHGFGGSDNPAAGTALRYDVQLITHNEFDGYYYATEPRREIIMNVSLRSGDRYITRISNVYPVNDYDYGLYLAGVASTRRMELVGP